jgi:hypothetical protein
MLQWWMLITFFLGVSVQFRWVKALFALVYQYLIQGSSLVRLAGQQAKAERQLNLATMQSYTTDLNLQRDE